MRTSIVHTIGAILGAAAAIWLWWAMQLPWWVGGFSALVCAALAAVWVGLQFGAPGAPATSARRSWIFVGASWISLTASVMVPILCWLLIPRYRIADAQESKALAERVAHLFYVEGAVGLVSISSLAGVRLWQPIGIVARFVLAAVCVGVGIYMIWLWAFSLSFWR
jgi:hypothetical protein